MKKASLRLDFQTHSSQAHHSLEIQLWITISKFEGTNHQLTHSMNQTYKEKSYISKQGMQKGRHTSCRSQNQVFLD